MQAQFKDDIQYISRPIRPEEEEALIAFHKEFSEKSI